MIVNKKIGILTHLRALNFGAVWQCYALMSACKKMGYEVETIDYNPFGHYTVIGALRYKPLVAYSYLMHMLHFNHFVHRYLNPTPHAEFHEWIKVNPPMDNVYIVGSDQIWANSSVGPYLDSYLLDFSLSNVKRIAYAASTGGNPMELNGYQLKELNRFSAISIREKQSVPDVEFITSDQLGEIIEKSNQYFLKI